MTIKTDNLLFDKAPPNGQKRIGHKAITKHEEAVHKMELAKQIKRASTLVHKSSRNILSKFENTITDGLKDT